MNLAPVGDHIGVMALLGNNQSIENLVRIKPHHKARCKEPLGKSFQETVVTNKEWDNPLVLMRCLVREVRCSVCPANAAAWVGRHVCQVMLGFLGC